MGEAMLEDVLFEHDEGGNIKRTGCGPGLFNFIHGLFVLCDHEGGRQRGACIVLIFRVAAKFAAQLRNVGCVAIILNEQ